jgi:molybdopterin molybdotransferase
MTELAGDCFAHGGGRISVREAHAVLARRAVPVVGAERVPLADAAGRCLAEPLVSARDVPAFDNAAVDGFAFAFRDGMRERGARLRLLPGRAAAGHPFAGELPAGAALRVLTGAVMPRGADTVALQEEAALAADATVTVPAGLRRGANRRRAGEDVPAGRSVLAPGTRLRPQEIGLAAELGCAALTVFRPLRVALLSTGDELVEAGDAYRDGGVFDANRPILRALLRSLPVEVTDLGIVADDAAAVGRALELAAAEHHVVLASGGASRGDEDHVARTVQARGRLDFWQIAMKPGRPLAFGRLADAVFVGLPGNPVAAMVCFLLFARPVLLRLAGFAWRTPTGIAVPAAFALAKRPGRSEYLRGRLGRDAEGGLVALRIAREGSGILTSMVEADGLIEVGDAVDEVRPGQPVPFLSFAELGVPT